MLQSGAVTGNLVNGSLNVDHVSRWAIEPSVIDAWDHTGFVGHDRGLSMPFGAPTESSVPPGGGVERAMAVEPTSSAWKGSGRLNREAAGSLDPTPQLPSPATA